MLLVLIVEVLFFAVFVRALVGYVRHREEGLRYVYTPTTTRASAQRTALRNLVRIFFGGSPRQTVTALLKQETWTDDELDALRAEIDRVRKERRRS